MATFNAKRIPSRPFGCWGLSAMVSVMVEMQVATRERRGAEAARENQNPNKCGRPSRYSAHPLTDWMVGNLEVVIEMHSIG